MKWLCMIVVTMTVALLMAAQDPPAPKKAGTSDLVAKAVSDYRAGRYETALASLLSELARVGGDVDVRSSDVQWSEQAARELRLNASLCALRLLRSRDAEELIAPLVDDLQWSSQAAFVLGMASSQHAERAVKAANLADAEPMAWIMAVRAIQGAEMQFRRCVEINPGWQEAVRNFERTIRRRAEIEAAREAAKTPDAKKEKAPKPEPEQPPKVLDQSPDVLIPEVAGEQLTARELAELQKRVRIQQRQKLTGRQQRNRNGAVAGEHDW